MKHKSYRLHSQSGTPKSTIKQNKLPQLARQVTNRKFLPLDCEQQNDYVKFFTTRTLQGYGGYSQHNQDSVFFQTRLCDNDERYLFGVCDGHGLDGHQMSYYVSNHYKRKLEEKQRTTLYFGDPHNINMKLMQQCVNEIDNQLQHAHFDTFASGATLLAVLINGDHILCQNIGNSRVVLFTKPHKEWKYKELSTDHKVSNPKECQRILQNGGKIEQLRNEFTNKKQGPYYVFQQDQNIPGLYATRSLGDQFGRKVGVIPESQFSAHLFKENGFLIIGTCGLWDILTYLEITEQLEQYRVVNQQKQIEELANQLLFYCKKKWEQQYNGNEVVKIEDISFILIYMA